MSCSLIFKYAQFAQRQTSSVLALFYSNSLIPLHPLVGPTPTNNPPNLVETRLNAGTFFYQRAATTTIKLQLASRNSLIWTEGLIQISQMGSRLHDNYCDIPTLP